MSEGRFAASGKRFVYEVPDYPDAENRMAVFVAAILACVAGTEPMDKGRVGVQLFRGPKI